MSKRLDSKAPVLPLTREDILGTETTPTSDRFSTTGSLHSQTSLPSLTTYAQRQQHRQRLKAIRESLNSHFRIPKYFKRIFNIKSLDFETAFWEMLNLIFYPKRVYKSLYYQKQTKNKWARDDPSFVIILCFLLTISAIFWGLMYSTSVMGIIKLISYMVIVDFILFGVIIASIGWILANNFFVQPGTYSLTESTYSNRILKKILPYDSILEWSYCFDVHCNAYLIIWVSLYLIQFFFIPLLRMNNIISNIVGNTLYCVALSYYFLITFYGYNSLPFLHKTEYLLVPILGFIILWLIMTLTGFNLANYMCNAYFN